MKMALDEGYTDRVCIYDDWLDTAYRTLHVRTACPTPPAASARAASRLPAPRV